MRRLVQIGGLVAAAVALIAVAAIVTLVPRAAAAEDSVTAAPSSGAEPAPAAPAVEEREPEVRVIAALPAQVVASPRVFQAPTAWLQPKNGVWGTLGIDHHGAPFAAVSGGLGGVAELDVTIRDIDGQTRPTALFKTGIALGHYLAVALGYRKSFGGDGTTAQAFAVASLDLGQLRLHGGIERWASAIHGGRADGFRPIGGLEWTPSIYPRTTILADLVWAPNPAEAGLAWVGSAGVRYTPFTWSSIELAFQIREHDLLDGAALFVRVNARWRK